MIRSMTGFGRGEFADEISKVTVEIRTVNHRYLDISVKMPRRYAFAEEVIKAAVKEKLYREKPKIFCVNDTEYTYPYDREIFPLIMEEIFPDKSAFEK